MVSTQSITIYPGNFEIFHQSQIDKNELYKIIFILQVKNGSNFTNWIFHQNMWVVSICRLENNLAIMCVIVFQKWSLKCLKATDKWWSWLF